MPSLPPSYVEHLVSPHGMGDVADAHAAGEIGSMVGGLGVRVTLAYRSAEPASLIREARGRAFGSAAAVAPLSWLCRAVEGRSWEEAGRHTHDDVLAALCGDNGYAPPEPVVRAAEFAVRALRRALGVARRGMPADPTGDGILVCRCLGVGDRKIRCAIRAGATTPEAIGERTRACTGCRSCRPDLLALIDEETRTPPPAPAKDRHPVARVALARAGPFLRGLGIPLEDAAVCGDVVRVRLGPPREDATLSAVGAVAITRHVLRETVSPTVGVERE